MDTLTEKGALERIANWLETSGGKLTRTQVQQMVEFARSAAASAPSVADAGITEQMAGGIRLARYLIDIIEGPFGWATCRSAHGMRLKDAPEYVAAYLGIKEAYEAINSPRADSNFVMVPRDLIGAACSAIDKKRDAPSTLAELRRYATGDLAGADACKKVEG